MNQQRLIEGREIEKIADEFAEECRKVAIKLLTESQEAKGPFEAARLLQKRHKTHCL